MTFDLVIIGGGPAGSSAALQAAEAGLRVCLLERDAFPRDRPGETLPPAVETLLAPKGIDLTRFPRHPGHWVSWNSPLEFHPFGSDEKEGSWRGFHAWRADFDALLLEHARARGVLIRQPIRALRPILEGTRVTGVLTSSGPIHARFLLDAAGSRHWLARHLDLSICRHSPPLCAVYRYATGELPGHQPCLVADATGWNWTSIVRPNLSHWTRVDFPSATVEASPPVGWQDLAPIGPPRRAEVTWRIVQPTAGAGYFLLGDAAAVLDPSASHGVLRAIMTGQMAAYLITRHLREGIAEESITGEYQRWLTAWFQHDTAHLRDFYRKLGQRW